MSIGTVLAELQQEFPDVTVSKIRFLESEGLISPSRSASGYRRFARADVDRLRYILTVQRDNYLPLKVIKEQLDDIDAGNVAAAGEGLASVTPLVTPDQFREAAVVNLSRAELAEKAGVDESFVSEPRPMRWTASTGMTWRWPPPPASCAVSGSTPGT